MNNEVLELFEKIKALEEPQLNQIVADSEDKLHMDFLPQVLIASNPFAKGEIIETLSKLIGSTNALLADVANAESGCIVRLRYGDDWKLDDADSDLNVMNISVPWDMLKRQRILWVSSSALKNVPESLLVDCDKLLLVTNAAMAMTQDEKDFLGKTRKSVFPDEPVTISLCRRELLNTQADADSLCAHIADFIAQYGENTSFVMNLEDALRSQFDGIDAELLKAKREKRILTACINALEAYIKSQLELAEVDIDKLNQKLAKIEAERKNIEFSGKLVLDSTIENMYGKAKNKIIAAADRYSDDACENIRAKLAASKTIEQDINGIGPYLKTAWENFEKEIAPYLVAEQEHIAGVVEEQISSDCRKMVDFLEAGSFGEPISISVAPAIADLGFADVDAPKGISRNMLITALALALVNPWWGVVSVVSSEVFSRYNNKKNLAEAKANVLSALPNECNKIKYGVESQIEAAIEKAKKESCDNVWKVYSEALDNLMTTIFGYAGRIKAAKEKADVLQSLLNTEIFEAKSTL